MCPRISDLKSFLSSQYFTSYPFVLLFLFLIISFLRTKILSHRLHFHSIFSSSSMCLYFDIYGLTTKRKWTNICEYFQLCWYISCFVNSSYPPLFYFFLFFAEALSNALQEHELRGLCKAWLVKDKKKKRKKKASLRNKNNFFLFFFLTHLKYRNLAGGAWSAPMHYTNVNKGTTKYSYPQDCPGLCVVSAIFNYTSMAPLFFLFCFFQ